MGCEALTLATGEGGRQSQVSTPNPQGLLLCILSPSVGFSSHLLFASHFDNYQPDECLTREQREQSKGRRFGNDGLAMTTPHLPLIHLIASIYLQILSLPFRITFRAPCWTPGKHSPVKRCENLAYVTH